jgi:hypothetical protein
VWLAYCQAYIHKIDKAIMRVLKLTVHFTVEWDVMLTIAFVGAGNALIF